MHSQSDVWDSVFCPLMLPWGSRQICTKRARLNLLCAPSPAQGRGWWPVLLQRISQGVSRSGWRADPAKSGARPDGCSGEPGLSTQPEKCQHLPGGECDGMQSQHTDRWHHSMRSLSRTLEQKCSMHCFSEVFVCFWAQQTDFTKAGVALHSGNSCTTCSVCLSPASFHKEGTGKPVFTLTHLFYSASCPEGWQPR